MIENLPRLDPDAARSAKTVARCHAVLHARRRRVEEQTRRPDTAERWVVSGLCLVYLLSMAANLLAIAAP